TRPAGAITGARSFQLRWPAAAFAAAWCMARPMRKADNRTKAASFRKTSPPPFCIASASSWRPRFTTASVAPSPPAPSRQSSRLLRRACLMKRRSYATNHVTWFFASLALFVALGFVDLVGGIAKAPNSLWFNVWKLFELWEDGKRETVIGQGLPIVAMQTLI